MDFFLQVSACWTKNSHNFSGTLSSDDDEEVLTYDMIEYQYHERNLRFLIIKGSGIRKAVYFVQLLTAWSLAIVLCLLVTGKIEVGKDGKSFA